MELQLVNKNYNCKMVESKMAALSLTLLYLNFDST